MLGQFRYVPPFSLPIRLFVEAKFQARPIRMPVVRNGHGVVHDINENVVATSPKGPKDKLTPGNGGRRVRSRYHYSYAIFSTSGFAATAIDYALAHQISLVDLSVPAFMPLRTAITGAAQAVDIVSKRLPKEKQPKVRDIRRYMRDHLNVSGHRSAGQELDSSIQDALRSLVRQLQHGGSLGLVLAFPEAPFVLGLVTDNLDRFIQYTLTHPAHRIWLRRDREETDGRHLWQLRPQDAPKAYVMTFTLPEQIESWILHDDEEIRRRAITVKRSLLNRITIYWSPAASEYGHILPFVDDDDHIRTFQLEYSRENITRI
ncbi:hypothetical protein [Pseudofrankia inefficax]|uniref:Restriction endonuclease type IV Mrr domain-containing protein n=1 Tax=Pseudofrankia inefficax (strain DSM 45817 / CECT 9037 / DDB 130130 / EuI1c) TaxID=298654 RepID=E3IUG3_PSEI1|nr:hypothetical protein [Pseudofrankia inefficax]ADP83648.1 hypothetical protein FraEuI1c_5664 [Pseudofrankia inefficax]